MTNPALLEEASRRGLKAMQPYVLEVQVEESSHESGWFYQPGDPSVLEWINQPQPTPGDHDLIVRVQAVSVNPADVQSRASTRPKAGAPLIGFPAQLVEIAKPLNRTSHASPSKDRFQDTGFVGTPASYVTPPPLDPVRSSR